MMLPAAITYGMESALIIGLGATIPVFLSTLADWKLGYLDKTSRKQNATRLATTLRLVKPNKCIAVYYGN